MKEPINHNLLIIIVVISLAFMGQADQQTILGLVKKQSPTIIGTL